ncbi:MULTISPECIES: Rrf2 family transcriptional regulator [unclassified Mesorhizobium]|uniref:RrF2 family transcriptional regulator n=1 Tax=unclassified Mesorhizobium TaxID=325217 RepID=UPI00112E45AE|nr:MULTISPECIES: Rrf2 family transcriptional regulator [unclassified Mesorhizobium]TPJ48383.1 Rrf2 family transcriptional regulator [Mesorhizobium sp. B2-6-4]TPM95463.1 Rrf2 family transcriptional regulator [Mesorhizobium sp. B2-1-5]TPN61166.1 Rrf2 family transcriptional regulator [Mesorhizobium sp. B1-1-1]
MRLTSFSDYALRMLMYTAAAGSRLITIEEVARTFNVSKTHLNKVANTLTRGGYMKAIRGRSGGLILGRRPEMIRIGDVVRLTEPDFALVECFATGNRCVLTASCKLSGMFDEATASFLNVLDRYTLADITLMPEDFLGGQIPPVRTRATRKTV